MAPAAAYDVVDAWRELWVPPLVNALVSPDRSTRVAAAVYGLSKLVAMDPGSARALFAAVDALAPPRGAAASRGELCWSDRVAWARMSIVHAARCAGTIGDGGCILLGGDERDVAGRASRLPDVPDVVWEGEDACSRGELSALDERGIVGVTHTTLMRALCHPDGDLRGAALGIVCATGRPSGAGGGSSMPSSLECRLLLFALRHAAAAVSDPKDRAEFSRALGVFADRLAAVAARLVQRGAAARAAPAADAVATPPAVPEAVVGADMTQVTPATSSQGPLPSRSSDRKEIAQLRAIRAVLRDAQRTLLSSLYPGSPYERVQTSLDALGVLSRAFPSVRSGFGGRLQDASILQLEVLREQSAVIQLLCTLVIGWERARESAARVSAISMRRRFGIR